MIEFLEESELPPPIPFDCERCGYLLSFGTDGYGSTETDCRAGNCAVLRCRNCGHEWASWGPIDCPCQVRDPKLRHIRRMYAKRRR